MRMPGAASALVGTATRLKQVQKRISTALDLLEGDTVDWARVNGAVAILKGLIEPV